MKRFLISGAATAAVFCTTTSAVFAQATAVATPVPGAVVPATISYAFTYTVDEKASVDPAKTPADSGAVFRTLARALADATVRKNNGSSVLVNLRPGTYREMITVAAPPAGTWAASNNDGAWLTLRRDPATSGDVVVSASTLQLPDGTAWNAGWTNVGNGVWKHAWPYKWGLSQSTSYYQNGPNLAPYPLIRRKELLYVNGQRLRQVGSTTNTPPAASAMPAGSFHVNVDANGVATGEIFVKTPSGITNLNGALVEVPLRDYGMSFRGRKNLWLQNLTFQHATGFQDMGGGYGLEFNNGCANVRVAHCTLRENNKRGLQLYFTNDVTLKSVDMSDNGSIGMNGWTIRNVRVEDCSTNRNNWRGEWGGYLSGAHPSGFKIVSARGTTWLRHTANDNKARGMWWDQDCTNTYVESCYMKGNYWSGMFIEYVQGPTTVKRCIIRDTKLAGSDESTQFTGGLLLSTCHDVTLESNIVYNNANWQLRILNTPVRGDFSPDMDTGQQLKLAPRRFSFKNNVFLGTSSDQIGLAFAPNVIGPNANYPYTEIYATMDSGVNTATSRANCFWHWSRSDLYGTTAQETFALTTRSLADWRTYSGQELVSIQQSPGFVDPANNNFALNAGSPVANWNLPTAPLQ